MTKTATIPDQDALRRIGAKTRETLEAVPGIYKLPTDKAEIFVLSDFLTPEECRRFITMIDVVARPSELHETAYIENFRTSSSGNFNPHDPFVKGVSDRIDKLLGMPSILGEAIQGQRYLPGQEFKPHNDWFYTDQPYWKEERKRGGQRCWTAMAFLNKVPQGGHTHYTHVGAKIEPKPGALVIWNNARPDGTPNEDTMHAGTPVIEGSKYVLTKWYRVRKHV